MSPHSHGGERALMLILVVFMIISLVFTWWWASVQMKFFSAGYTSEVPALPDIYKDVGGQFATSSNSSSAFCSAVSIASIDGSWGIGGLRLSMSVM